MGEGVFLGHLTEGKVQIDREETFVQQLAEFNARICVRFSMPESYKLHPGEILLTIDCFTSKSLHSADIILNGEVMRSKVEVQDEIFGRQPVSLVLPKSSLHNVENIIELVNVPPGDKALLVQSFELFIMRKSNDRN